jgi:type III secretion protein L
MLQLKDLASLSIEPGRKIVRAEELETCIDAQGILDAARAEAKRIVDSAQAEFDRQSTAGYEDGMTAGRMEMAERMIDSVSKTVNYVSGLERSVVDIVMKALRKILGDMPDRERVAQVVRSALSVARNQRNVAVRVHPDDADHVRSQLAEITKPYPGVHFLECTPDARLQRGACILESEVGVIDASLDVQLKAIENSLSRTLVHNVPEEN